MGSNGSNGSAATVSVGTVESDVQGNERVTNSGTSTAAVFDFVLPIGDTGAKGQKGAAGSNGSNGTNGSKGQKGEA